MPCHTSGLWETRLSTYQQESSRFVYPAVLQIYPYRIHSSPPRTAWGSHCVVGPSCPSLGESVEVGCQYLHHNRSNQWNVSNPLARFVYVNFSSRRLSQKCHLPILMNHPASCRTPLTPYEQEPEIDPIIIFHGDFGYSKR